MQNRPYDYPLTTRGLHQQVRLAVICPRQDMNRLGAYLSRLHTRHPVDSKEEYLLDYPGFAKAFGLALDISHAGATWVECPEPDPAIPMEQGARFLATELTKAVDAAMAGQRPNVIVLYVPGRWRQWEGYSTEQEQFDLHNFVKAYCVQRGVATQFLREATLTKSYQCEVMWWLSLSFYVKAMRTPWLLEGVDPDTAFVGLGFSVNPAARPGQHIILGCSHIYNAHGMGLQYRLSKVENPIWRRRNPFMSLEDARRLGETVRQMFYGSTMRLPRRVVIHKRTPFIGEEQQGLCEGLAGIDAIEMLEINFEESLRYVASRIHNGEFQGDAFPVARGTAVVLQGTTALLWVHGAAPAVQQGRRYYQGKSRIPAPLVVRRHHGSSPLQVIALEILGLSKMNWNSFDLYTKLPATIHSSDQIARIGSLLQRFEPESYDYRLFI